LGDQAEAIRPFLDQDARVPLELQHYSTEEIRSAVEKALDAAVEEYRKFAQEMGLIQVAT
jgi:hypothetical protein